MFAKNARPDFQLLQFYSNKNRGSKKQEEKGTHTQKMVVAFSAATVNILWMDTSEQSTKIKIPYNYLSNTPCKDLDFATSP